jgi:hypothetical protein
MQLWYSTMDRAIPGSLGVTIAAVCCLTSPSEHTTNQTLAQSLGVTEHQLCSSPSSPPGRAHQLLGP